MTATTSPTSSSRSLTWIVVESGERWYRAICRFGPSSTTSERRMRVVRATVDQVKAKVNLALVVQADVRVLWEMPQEGAMVGAWLDNIAALRAEHPRVQQFSSTMATRFELQCLANEAGICRWFASPAQLQDL